MSLYGQKYQAKDFCGMMSIKEVHDFPQASRDGGKVGLQMVFSKSFGYAIRCVLYLAFMKDQKEKLQLEEIAEVLNVPRFFLAKVMNKLVKEGIVDSVKGHNGGFAINERTLSVKLTEVMALTGESAQFTQCVLQLGRCNAAQPCPIHYRVESLRQEWQGLFRSLRIEDLLKKDQQNFIESLVTL